jgi:hypothetical protein
MHKTQVYEVLRHPSKLKEGEYTHMNARTSAWYKNQFSIKHWFTFISTAKNQRKVLLLALSLSGMNTIPEGYRRPL